MTTVPWVPWVLSMAVRPVEGLAEVGPSLSLARTLMVLAALSSATVRLSSSAIGSSLTLVTVTLTVAVSVFRPCAVR